MNELEHMSPAGYLYKKISTDTEWLQSPHVKAIYTVSNCMSQDHQLFIPEYFYYDQVQKLARNPNAFVQAAAQEGVRLDLAGYTLLYYTMYDREFDEERIEWRDLTPEEMPSGIVPPREAQLLGFDAAVWQENVWGVGCSPLSCNCVAPEIESVNEYCLFPTLENAVAMLDAGKFTRCEPGPYRIFGVYLVNA